MAADETKLIRILLVDDDEDEYVIARDLFREIGDCYSVHWFSRYAEGLEEIAKNEYDICLLDYHLGEYTGIDFIKEALARMALIPIILLTRQGDHEVDMAAMKAGAVDYLDKNNLNGNSLERAVRYALERKKQEDRIRYLAYYDQLTNLPNRVLFLDRLHIALATAKRHGRTFSVMFLDIDNFKRINDTLGHFIGDELIREMGRRLLGCIRKEDAIAHDRFENMLDTVARLGGDEFTILLSEIKEAENTSKVAERIQHALKQPVTIEGNEINVTASIGIAVYPEDGVDVKALLQNADLAMYDAKASGRNNYKYYNASMNSVAQVRLSLENDLRRAVAKNQLEVYFQPYFDLESMRMIGVEALLRWNHPERGIILPRDFIPIAEDTGLIAEIDDWVIDFVCRTCRQWREAGFPHVSVAVNLTRAQFNRKDFVETIRRKKELYGIESGRLVLEITEKCFIGDISGILPMIEGLKAAGIGIALDNFGSGISSYNNLMRIPFDIFKIDKYFITRLNDEKSDTTMIASAIHVCHSLNIKVVAVGIENTDQREILRSCSCDIGQGNLFCLPVPNDKIAVMYWGGG